MPATSCRSKRRPIRRRFAALGTAAAVGALVLAGCGGATSNGVAAKTPTQIYAAASNAVSGLRSIHVHGTIQEAKGGSLGLDLYDGQGAGGGTVTLNGHPLQVVETAGSLYLRGDSTIWMDLSGSTKAATALAGKWLKTTSDDSQFASLADLVSVRTLVSNLSRHGNLTKGRASTYEGKPAVGLVDTQGSGGTLYVATTGQPYLLGIDGGSAGKITFDQFGTAKLPTTPPGAQSLSAIESQIGG